MTKAKVFHERIIHGRLEERNSFAQQASLAVNKYERRLKEDKFTFAQFGRKGLSIEDKGKRPNFGEYYVRMVPAEELETIWDPELQVICKPIPSNNPEDTNSQTPKVPNVITFKGKTMEIKSSSSMTQHQKIMEKHKLKLKRNFLAGSKQE